VGGLMNFFVVNDGGNDIDICNELMNGWGFY
jgi:hypothetical protein